MNDQTVLRLRFDACQFVYLQDFRKSPSEMDLRLTIVEARLQPPAPLSPTGRRMGPPQMPIATRAGYDRFVLLFRGYTGFTIRDASEVTAEEGEEQRGNLREHEASGFMDYIRLRTLAVARRPDDFIHYSIACLSHVVDVVSAAPPEFALSAVRDEPPRGPI